MATRRVGATRGLGRRTVLAAATAGLAGGLAVPRGVRAQGRTIVAHGIAMHGDLKYGPDAKALDHVNLDAPKGGSARLAARGTFDSFNPFILKGVPAAGIGNLYETLTASGGDEAFSEYCKLAETIEYPEDRSWVAFTLRPEARWHDGKPVTAADVVFSLNVLKEKGQPNYAFYYQDVVGAEALGERKVRFAFKPGENRELPLIVGQMPVLPKHHWDGREFDRSSLDVPVGSGPYRVESFDAGRSVVYRRDPNWWGRDVWLHRGRHNIDTLRYDYYRDATVIFEAFKAGEIDFRQENIARNWATAYDFPAVRAGHVRRDEIEHELPAGMQCFAFNLRRDPFKDRRVREAIATMFDFEWSNKNLFYGLYRRNTSFFSNSELASSGLPSPEELAILGPMRGRIPDEVFTQEFRPPVTDGSGANRDQARRALALLKEAGFEVRNGKMSDAAGRPVAFEMLLNDASFERVVLPYKQSLERIGVEMRVRTVDTAQFKRREDEFDFDMMIEGFGQSLSPGNEQRDFWGSAGADTKGSRNTLGIKSAEIDRLVELVISAPDRQSLIHRTRALDRVLLWGHYVVPNWHNNKMFVAYWNKFSRPARSAKYSPVAFDTWWVDPAKERALPRAGGERR